MAMPIVSYTISLKGLIYYSTTYYSETLGRFKYKCMMFLNYLILLLNMGYKILCMERNSKNIFYTCKNESNATILILNTIQYVDFIM
jgi:hypothetical protein